MPEVATARGVHARLSAFYFFFYAQLGAMLPYWALWLRDRGYGAEQIGGVFAVLGLSRLFVPVLWGWFADRSGRRLQIIRATTAAALLCFALFPATDGYAALLALTAVFALFWHAAMPQFEVVTLDHLRRTGQDYSRIRLWGSVGFVASVTGIGFLLDRVDIAWLPWLGVCLIAGMLGAGLATREIVHDAEVDDPALSLWRVLRRPSVVGLLLICFLSQFSFAPYYGFFSLFLDQHGYGRGQTGLLWALGVVAEIWVFLYTGRLFARFGVRRVMMFAMACTALRWFGLPVFVDNVAVLVLLQVLHFASFGLYHASAIACIQREFPGRLHGRGQALYSAVSFGAGGAIGSYAAGALWDGAGPDLVFALAGIAGAAGLVVAAWLLRRDAPVPAGTGAAG